MSDMTDVAGRIECESHHWVSTNVPGLLTRWIIQCSLCGAYNVEEMNAALSAAGFGPVREARAEAWDEGYLRGQYPWTKVGPFVDPIPSGVGPARSGLNANPYKEDSNDDQ